jgi:AraC-like DNA-binding protein
MGERVRIWRPGEESRVLLMKGQTTHYALHPRGEYVFGVVAEQPMRAHRGRETRLVAPGQLVAWDPSAAHSGSAVAGRPWRARLMVVELAELTALIHDSESDVLTDVAFPEPVVSDPELANRFGRLHARQESASTRLERDEQLSEWLRAVVERHSARRTPQRALTGHDRRALRLALEYLAEHFESNVSLDELANAAGIGKFRLVRIFRKQTGLAPHALQIAYRVRAARRLLEAGETIAATAAATGFADQSHLHRHFRASIGWTPRHYQRRMKAH